MNTWFINGRSIQGTILLALATLSPSQVLAQSSNSDPPYSVTDRGPFYRVLQRTTATWPPPSPIVPAIPCANDHFVREI